MKKTYEKPGLESRSFAHFENVFTACDKGNWDPRGCVWCNNFNPGDESKPCPDCGQSNNQHAAHTAPGGGVGS